MDAPAPPRDGGTAKARYLKLKPLREPFLFRAYDCAKLTIPSILPPRGHSPSSKLPQPYQGLGAKGTTNLANRVMMALLPAGANHFRLAVPAKVLVKQGVIEVPEDINHQLASTENLIQEKVDRLNWREATNLAAQHLVVTGNVLEMMTPDGNLRSFRLDQYVVVRDHTGTLTEIVIQECFTKDSLPPRLQAYRNSDSDGDNDMELYTWVQRQPDGTWKVSQEIEDQVVAGSAGSYAPDALPFWPLRWAAVIGEDYGRGKIEEHWADLKTLDGLTKALIDGSAMAARNIPMVKPNAAGGLNLRRKIATAENGEIVIGNPDDVGMLQFTNVNGMQFVAQTVERFSREVGAAFLLNSSMRRDAERVTATELRQMAEELDGMLGGVYSVLSRDMALPRLSRLILQMQAAAELPNWPAGMVEPTILTGIEALGRERDLQRIGEILQLMQGLPPDVIQNYPKWSVILDKGFVAAGLPGCVNTQQEVEAIQRQEAAIQALQNAAPTVADKVLPSADSAQPAPPQPAP